MVEERIDLEVETKATKSSRDGGQRSNPRRESLGNHFRTSLIC